MATVHRAEQDTPAGIRRIALKRLTPKLDKQSVGLFLDEVRLLRYLHHPNIPETYDSGRVFGTYFIAMEYVEGPTLKSLIDHCSATVGPVPVPIVLNLATQLCDALDYVHKLCDEHGKPLRIIHRDVTPSNLIIDPKGSLKLVDFGLAKATVATEPSTAGVIKGKLGYVAPEYTRGELDHRAQCCNRA
jgi:serine/threonine-protein kinase